MSDFPFPLSPADIDSFAYLTFKDRLPVIITRIVDYVYRNKKSILDTHGNDKVECIKYITSELSRLRHELTTDKVITLIETDSIGDKEWWNNAINEERKRLIDSGTSNDDEIHWYKTTFLFGENYMYRRIWDIVTLSGLQSFDQFCFEKEEQLQKAPNFVEFLSNFLKRIKPSLSECNTDTLEEYFEIFLKMSLWGNEADLSLSVSEEECKLKSEEPRLIVESNNCKLLVDDHRPVFAYLYRKSRSNLQDTSVTIILDNCATELLADLHLVEFLFSAKLVSKVVLIVKPIPWYVSDVTDPDIHLTLAALSSPFNSESLQSLARSISSRLANHSLIVSTHLFFTLPHPFCRMEALFPELYASLATASLLIFKGDLNYRKLVGDLCWDPVATTFHHSLRGFLPSPLVALRVLKCDVQVGLTADALARARAQHPDDWMTTSRFGLVQAAALP